MITHPEETHAQLEYHWVKGIFQHYREKAKPTWEAFANEYQEILGPKHEEFKLPPITAKQFPIKLNGEEALTASTDGDTRNYVSSQTQFGNC